MNPLKKYKLSELYELSSGISTSTEQAGHGYPFCSFRTIFNNMILPDELPDLMDTSDKEREVYSIKEGDVLLTRTSEKIDELAITSVALKDYPNATYSGFAKRLRPINKKTYPRYMAFFFRSQYFRKIVTNKATMTLRASFSEDTFNDISIELPDYDEQVVIGDWLYSVESKRINNSKICEDIAKIINLEYNFWFNQFEFPNDDGNPYKASGGKMIWCPFLKREIPEGWSYGNLVESQLCSTIKPGVKIFDVKSYLPTSNVNGDIISEGEQINYDNRESRANMEPQILSVWFAKMKNSIKHISVPENGDWFVNKYILSTGFEGLKCTKDSFPYIHSFVASSYFERCKDTLAHGATQESVNDEDLKSIKLVIPTDDILKKYAERINPLLKMSFDCIKENQELSLLIDFIFPKLMTGQAVIRR